jgi:hypothetical protein
VTPRGGLPGRTVVRPALRGLMARVLRRRLATGVMLADFRLGVGGGISSESGARDHMGRQTKASALAICAALQLSLSRRSTRSRTPSQQPVALFREDPNDRRAGGNATDDRQPQRIGPAGRSAGRCLPAGRAGGERLRRTGRRRHRPSGRGADLVQQLVHRQGSTSTVVHVLAERGLLDDDTPIADYWPEFRAHGKQTVTLAHVLTHSAGNLATSARALVSGSRVPRSTPQTCSANTPSSANRQIQASLLLRPYS